MMTLTKGNIENMTKRIIKDYEKRRKKNMNE